MLSTDSKQMLTIIDIMPTAENGLNSEFLIKYIWKHLNFIESEVLENNVQHAMNDLDIVTVTDSGTEWKKNYFFKQKQFKVKRWKFWLTISTTEKRPLILVQF